MFKRAINYRILDTPTKHTLKKRNSRLDIFGVHYEQQCDMRFYINHFKYSDFFRKSA